jgi:hypothetical protein
MEITGVSMETLTAGLILLVAIVYLIVRIVVLISAFRRSRKE